LIELQYAFAIAAANIFSSLPDITLMFPPHTDDYFLILILANTQILIIGHTWLMAIT